MNNLTMKPVKSSNLAAVGYDDANGALIVHFKNHMVYRYADVPRETYEEMMVAESVGKFLFKEISPNYQYEKLDNWQEAE